VRFCPGEWVSPTPLPCPPNSVHHIAEIMPHVLDSYGLSFEDEPVSEGPAVVSDPADLFDVLIACLESAIAG
jgi:hypothetical protein